MILAIDVGNSNIVMGCISDGDILFEARMASDTVKTSDQYCAELKTMLDLFRVDLDTIEGTIISSVVPQLMHSLRTAVRKLTGRDALVVGPGLKTGLNICIDNPAQAGSDLIVAAVAAIRTYGAPLIIIDMGTATTISVVDRNRNFIGGTIAPGVKISLSALTGRTAQLPGISLDAPEHVIGRNTVDSMQSGIMYGTAAMLDGMINRIEAELGYPATVVATGGLSRYIAPLCSRQILIDKDLLLQGLALIYDINRPKSRKERD